MSRIRVRDRSSVFKVVLGTQRNVDQESRASCRLSSRLVAGHKQVAPSLLPRHIMCFVLWGVDNCSSRVELNGRVEFFKRYETDPSPTRFHGKLSRRVRKTLKIPTRRDFDVKTGQYIKQETPSIYTSTFQQCKTPMAVSLSRWRNARVVRWG